MIRSTGITVLCVVLGLFTIAGFGDSIVMLSGQIELIPTWLGFPTLIFGLSAGGAAAGLWRMKRWGLHSLRAWFIACFILLFTSAYVFNSPIIAVAIVALVFAGLFLALDRFVSSKMKLAAQQGAATDGS